MSCLGPDGATVSFADVYEPEADSIQAEGPLFRRDTGVRGDTRGAHHWCDHPDGYSPSHGCLSYADTDVAIRFDSSISGHWARFYVTASGKRQGYGFASESRSEPYGNGGWKITRVS